MASKSYVKYIKVTPDTRKLILNLITMIYDMMDDNRLIPGLESFNAMRRNARGLYGVLDDGKYNEETQKTLNSWRKYYINYTEESKNGN